MQVRQFKASYVPIQDRITLFVNTSKDTEYQVLLTRRFVKIIIDAILKVLDYEPQVAEQTTPAAKRAVIGLAQQEAMNQVSLEKEYVETKKETPKPIQASLATKLTVSPSKKGAALIFYFENNRQISLYLTMNLMLVVFNLLTTTANKAGWDLPQDVEELPEPPSDSRH